MHDSLVTVSLITRQDSHFPSAARIFTRKPSRRTAPFSLPPFTVLLKPANKAKLMAHRVTKAKVVAGIVKQLTARRQKTPRVCTASVERVIGNFTGIAAQTLQKH
ncbi:unnamed protein product, partial [Phaeothamnion confervicola]